MAHADMQPCDLQGELRTHLLRLTPQAARADVFLEPPAAAALAPDAHSNLVDKTRTEPMSRKKKQSTKLLLFPRSA